MAQASAALPNITLAATTDLALAGSGLDLSLTRTYSASLLNRNNAGVFGDGWTFTYGVQATTDASGDVYITSSAGTEVFTLNSDGIYSAEAGHSSTLTEVNGAYVLTESSGAVEKFLADGDLSSIADANGNVVTVSYGANGYISGLTSSNGQSIAFTTNAAGRITSATDNDGETITYTYDASDDHLLSVTGPNGATTYSYSSSDDAYVTNALTGITNPDGVQQTFTYDSQGDLASQTGASGIISYSYPGAGTLVETDAAGDKTTLSYDESGNLVGAVDAEGNGTTLTYDGNDDLTSVATPLGETYAYAYDALGNLTSYTDPTGGVVTATYEPGTNLLTSLTDQNGNATNYSYNSAGDLTGITYDNGSTQTYTYSSSGAVTSSTDQMGRTTTYAYNSQGLLANETFADGTSQSYTYNALGELTSATATNGAVTNYTYNAAGELMSVTNAAGQIEFYTWNALGQEASRTEPDGSVTNYAYNADGQLATLTDGSGSLITQYAYNSLGQLIGSLDGNGQTTSYSYDADGDVTQILVKDASGNVTGDLTYTYDADGRPITATSLDGTWTYSYNGDSELVRAVFDSTDDSIANQDLTYEYDAAGNRTKTIFNGAVDDYTTNGLNQYTAVDGTTYDYDANGNLVSMTQSGQTTTYTYNDQNELVEVSGPSGTTTYTYDALGNVVSTTADGVTTNYVIDPLAISTSATGPLSAIAQAYNASGTVTATYDYGNGLTAEVASGGKYYYGMDATGNVISLSGDNGELVNTYDYTPFGSLIASKINLSNPFQYGGYLGTTSGVDDLVDMRARVYDPAIGRFTSIDPLGLVGGINLYAYSDQDPVEFVDPSGLSPFTPPAEQGFFHSLFNDLANKFVDDADKRTLTEGYYDYLVEGTVNNYDAAAQLNNLYQTNLTQNINQALEGSNLQPQVLPLIPTSDQLEEAFWRFLSYKLHGESVTNVGGTGAVSPDPHLITFDGLHYDFQTVGEFVLVKDTSGGTFQVQARLSAPENVSNYSVITEIGIEVGEDVVTIDSTRSAPVWVDGQAVTFTGNTIGLADGLITQTATGYVVTLNTGESVTATLNGNSFGTQSGPSTSSLFGITVSVSLAPNAAHGSVEGLLGNYNGNPDDDLTLADGTVEPTDMSTATLYGAYADSWRVTQATSLLNYGPGQTTATFTDTNYPGSPISVSSFPAQAVAAATQLVEQAGITDPGLQQEAIYDYLVTGDPSVISVEANLQQQGVTTTTQADFVAPTPPPEIGIMALDPSDVESASGSTTATFEIYATGNSSQAATVDYTVVAPDDTFVGSDDFGGALPSGTLTIAAGQASADFSITLPNGIGEAVSKTLEVQISAAAPATVIGPSAQETIFNDAPVAGVAPVFGVQLVNLPNLLPTQNGTNWTFNLGALKQGEIFSPGDLTVAVLNMANNGGDNLAGIIAASGDGGLPTGVSPSFTGLEPDGILDIANLAVETTTPGTHTETFTFTPYDTNATGYAAIMPTETVTVTDTVYPLAQAELSTNDIDFGVVRVGSSQQQSIGITNDGPAGAEFFDASIGAITGAGTSAGSISLLAVDQTSSAIAVGLNTSEAGSDSGSVAVDLSSDGANVDGLGVTSLLPQDVAVSGTVFREAAGQVTPAQTIVHVGDPGTVNLVVSNTDPADGYSEGLLATLVSSSGAISASGVTTGLIAAGASDSTSLTANFSTATAGIVSGAVAVDFQTDGYGTSGLGTLDLGTSDIPIAITVDNYATAAWEEISGGGTFSQSGNNYTLNLGTIKQGSGLLTVDLGALNSASGPADALSGSFQSTGSSAFALSGFDDFANLAAGQADTSPTVMLDTSADGEFTETITLDGTGSNASGYSSAVSPTTLTITADVVTPVANFSVAQYLADPAAADASLVGFNIVDLAANIPSALDSLNRDTKLLAIELTDGGTPTLTLTIEEALNDTTALSKITSPHTLTISDSATDIAALTLSEASQLHGDGYTTLFAKGPLALPLAEANLLNSYDLTVTGGPVTVVGSVAAMLALSAQQVSTYLGAGYLLGVEDTAHDIDELTSKQITALAANHVTLLTATDMGLAISEAEAVELEAAGISVAAPAGATAVVSDKAGDIGKLTGPEISALKQIGVTGIVSTNASITLNVAQALALEGLGWTIAVPSGDTIRVVDAGSAIAGLTPTGIFDLVSIGVTSVTATGEAVTLSVLLAQAFEGASLTLTPPSGTTNAISDFAAQIEALTASQINGLSKLHVTSVTATNAGLTLSAGVIGALISDKIALNVPTGDHVAISDTASDIEALTTAQFNGLSGYGVTSVAATDVGLALSEAAAADFANGGISVSVTAGYMAVVSDTGGNLVKLSATQFGELASLGFSGLASTSGSVTLSVAQAEELETLGWTIAVPAGATRTVKDAASAIEGMSAAEIADLANIGVTAATPTGGAVTLTVAQVDAFETAGVTLAAASGYSNAISDFAVQIETLTALQINGLAKLHVMSVTAADAGLTLCASAIGALISDKIALSVPAGDTVAISDTASDIEALTTAQFSALSGYGVTSITATDAPLTLTYAEASALEAGGISVTVPGAGSSILSDTASNLEKLTVQQIDGLAGVSVGELFSTNANVSFTAAQTAALIADDVTLAAAGSYTVTENFANSGYSVYQDGTLITEKSVNADGSYDIAHFDVTGQSYTSYEDVYSSTGSLLAENRNMNGGTGALILDANGLTVQSGPSALTVSNGTDTFSLDAFASEAITASGRTSEVFAYDAGFGASAITGFAATGSAHDILQVQSAMFNNAAALLNAATQSGANVIITDASGDTITFNNISKTTLTANTGDFRFV